MRICSLIALVALGTSAMAGEPGYRLSMGAEVQGNMLALAPTITAPAGKTLRYELVTTKSGRSGNSSNTRQGGSVKVDEAGQASLSKVSVSVGEGERCEVSLKVYDGTRLVASDAITHSR